MRFIGAKSTPQLAAILLVSVLLGTSANAGDTEKKSTQPTAHHHAMADAQQQMPKTENAYAAVMNKMHKSMMTEGTGDVDVDFMRGMIPHHQGAIDMAKIALEKSTDPVVRQLAEGIIKAQESEITLMQNWLAKRTGP
jgi:uncharacterized protein (DUF305 family)